MRTVATLVFLTSCAAPDAESPELDRAYAALDADATVADAIESECSTASIRALGQQLVDEVQCTQPGTFTRIDDIDNVVLGTAAFPWLQTPAADALRVVASKRPDEVMTINSAYRTVAQQLMLYSWYRNGRRCGISLAATPGNSNHESALAVDVDENAAWRAAFRANDFTWLGSSDPVHFDYSGDAPTVDLRELSVAAFQRLWNRNHPEDPIEEDGDYGGATEARILRSPAAGFEFGAPCIAAPSTDAGAPAMNDAGLDAGAPTADASNSMLREGPRSPEESGCSMHRPTREGLPWALGALALMMIARATGRGTPAASR